MARKSHKELIRETRGGLRPVNPKALARIKRTSAPPNLEEKIYIVDQFNRKVKPSIIAVNLGRTVVWVNSIINKYRSTSPLARATIEAGAERLARRIISKANVEESLEVLDRLDVLNKKRDKVVTGPSFSLIIGMPGQPGPVPPDPILIGEGKV